KKNCSENSIKLKVIEQQKNKMILSSNVLKKRLKVSDGVDNLHCYISNRNEWYNVKWIEICIHTTNEAVEPITNIFRDMGSDGTMIADAADLQKERKGRFGEIYELNPVDFPQEGVHIKAYFPSDSKLHSKLEKMRQEVENLALYGFDLGKNKWTYREIEDADWASAWKTYYKPVKISEKIIIVPTWEDYHPKPD